MFGARFAVFVRRARVLPGPCHATRNLSFLRLFGHRHPVVSTRCLTGLVRVGVKITLDGKLSCIDLPVACVYTPIRFTRPNTALHTTTFIYALYLLTPHTTTLTSPRSSPTNTILLDGKTSMQVIFPLNFPLLPVLPPFINKLRVTNSFHFPTFE